MTKGILLLVENGNNLLEDSSRRNDLRLALRSPCRQG